MKIDKSLIIKENDTLNEMRDKVHQNAINHGWADKKRSISEFCALFHSEVSEILEEFRMKEPEELYFIDAKKKIIIGCESHYVDMGYLENDFNVINKEYKPCGYGIELADLVIRLLDFCGEKGINIKETIEIEVYHSFKVIETINSLHYRISELWLYDDKILPEQIADIFVVCFEFAKNYNINLNKMIEIKHKYNLTRPKKHGKRF